MKSLVLLCLLALILLARSCPAHDKPTEPPFPSRAAFAARMAKVQPGMTTEQVTALLGKPDLIREGMEGVATWLYGVTPKSGCPSLGTVQFDKHNKVERTVGGEGSPPPESLISEKDLRELLDVIGGLSPLDSDFDPLACIKAVNTLLPYGKERVLAIAREYRRVCRPKQETVVYLLRLLFESPDDPIFLPDAYDGLHDPSHPDPEWHVGDYPVVTFCTIPLCLVTGTFSSSDDYVSQVMDTIAKHGVLRKFPLNPGPDFDGIFYLLDRFKATGQWLFGPKYMVKGYDSNHELYEDRLGCQIVRRQLLKLIRSVIPESSPYYAFVKVGARDISPDEFWRLRAELVRRSFRWNPVHNDYEASK